MFLFFMSFNNVVVFPFSSFSSFFVIVVVFCIYLYCFYFYKLPNTNQTIFNINFLVFHAAKTISFHPIMEKVLALTQWTIRTNANCINRKYMYFEQGKNQQQTANLENNWLKRRTSERDSDRAERIINVKRVLLRLKKIPFQHCIFLLFFYCVYGECCYCCFCYCIALPIL